MKIYFMGTAAYERVPALFCKCEACTKAMKLGKKNMRTQAQVLIDEELLVDFGQDNYLHFLKSGKDFTKVKDMLLTHAHSDHFMPNELIMTTSCYGYNDMDNIRIFGNEECGEKYALNKEEMKCRYTIVKPYETFKTGKYTIMPIPANRGTKKPLCYIISDSTKTLLYNNDSGLFKNEVYSFIKESKFKFDAVVCDCTSGLIPGSAGTL